MCVREGSTEQREQRKQVNWSLTAYILGCCESTKTVVANPANKQQNALVVPMLQLTLVILSTKLDDRSWGGQTGLNTEKNNFSNNKGTRLLTSASKGARQTEFSNVNYPRLSGRIYGGFSCTLTPLSRLEGFWSNMLKLMRKVDNTFYYIYTHPMEGNETIRDLGAKTNDDDDGTAKNRID